MDDKKQMGTIGTAGHVDHGKSTLVKALTGIDPDRLAEEKERGMTIDLGFAWLALPGGREVSIVDVPGHESFIKNMLAGVGGIDAALLIIAADEGIMPQTREHLAILDQLQVQHGIIVLTKADLVDEEWLELVHEEVKEYLRPTTLANASILPVSAYTGQGLSELLSLLENMLDNEQERLNIARPRLPVDRVFTMTGFGTVVTGTLLDGSLKVGQEVEILPQGLRSRIRSLQTHRNSVQVAHPGSRVAINLPNIARSDIARGNVIALPGQLRTTMLLDAHVKLLTDTERPLMHNTQVDFYSGSQEIPARVRLLDTEELQPGQSAWVQLRLSRPAVVARRDRFILRIPSPSATIGGGEVLDVGPRYHRRFQVAVLEQLATLEFGAPDEILLAALDKRPRKPSGPMPPTTSSQSTIRFTQGLVGYEFKDIVKQSNLSDDVTRSTLETLLTEGRVRQIGPYWYAETIWEELQREAIRLVQEYHQHYPLRSGLSKEEWRTRLKLSPRMAADVFVALHAAGKLAEATNSSLIRLPQFTPQFTAQQQQQVAELLHTFRQHPYVGPVRAEAEAIVGAEILAALLEQGQLIKLGDGVLFLQETYTEAVSALTAYLQEHETMTAAEARDVLGTSRKYILPLLEHLDTLKITRRIGDERVLFHPPH